MNIIVGCFLFESDGTLFGKWWLCLASYVANHWNRKLQRVACCNARRRKAHESTLFVFEASEPDPEFVVIPELMLMMLLLLMMMMMMINFTGSLYIWVEITTFACIYRFSIKPIHWNVLGCLDPWGCLQQSLWWGMDIKIYQTSMGIFLGALSYIQTMRIVEGQGISLASPWLSKNVPP